MKKQQAIELLTRSKPILQEQFGVTKLALFGSTARDTATTSLSLIPYIAISVNA